MNEITQCYICDSTNLIECEHEDWDDVLDEEEIRTGIQCLDCKTFHYEKEDRVVCIIAHKEETASSLNGYIPEI